MIVWKALSDRLKELSLWEQRVGIFILSQQVVSNNIDKYHLDEYLIMKFSRIIGKITTGSLITAGLVAVVFSIGDIFLDYSQIDFLQEAPSIAVPLIVGLLCFAIGLERADQFENIKQTLMVINNGVTNFQ